MDNNTFIDNSADNAGGAVKWTTIEPEISNLTFGNNFASLYGDNIAGVA